MRAARLFASALVVALALPVQAQTGRVSAGNSTTATLAGDATFTGTWDDATQAAVVVVTVKADQASATNGVKIQFSSDCSNLDYVSTTSFTDTANGATVAVATAAKCVRLVYTNGSAAQGTFRLQTIFRDAGYGGTSGGGAASTVTINDPTTTTQKAAVNASGQLSITCANCSGSGASAVDNSAFTAGTTSGAPAMGFFHSTIDAVTDGRTATLAMDAKRSLFTVLRDAAGNARGVNVTAGNALTIDGSGFTQPVSGTFWQATQPVSGTVTANQGGTWTVQPGNTANTTAWKVDGSAVTQPVSGTFWQATQPVSGTVTANIGTTNGLALDASVTGLEVAQGSTTSGQKGALVQGAVTTAAPSYTTAQTSPLSLTTAGLLRTDGSGVTQPVSGTVTANAGSGTFTVSGTVTANQGGAPWAENVTQFGGTNVSTGTGTGGAGIPRVTVSNDSNVLSTQSGTWTVQPGNTANTTAWKVDGSAVTQPVSGTVTANAGTGTFTTAGAKTNNNAAPGATNVGVLSALANASAPSYTEGNQVTLSTDLAGALRVSGSAGGGVAQTQVRNASNAWNDVGYSAGNAQLPVQDAYLLQVVQALLVAQQRAGYIKGTFGRPVTSTGDALDVNIRNNLDPCQGANKFNAAISQTATSRLVPGQEGKRIFVCYGRAVAGAAEIVSFIEGLGSNCGTGPKAVSGSTTAANGESYAANGGFSGGGGYAIAITAIPGNDLCLAQNGAQRVSGNITFVYQ